MTTAAARNIIKNVIGTSTEPLTTKELYQLSVKKFPKATIPKESKPVLNYGNPPLKPKMGVERKEPPSAPRPNHPIPSMVSLKRRILPDLVARKELVKVHVRRPAGGVLQALANQSSSSQTSNQVDPSTVKMVDAWVWQFPKPAQPPAKNDKRAQAALTPKIPQSPNEPEPQFKRPKSSKPKQKTHLQMYPPPQFVHLNSRRRKARAEKIGKRRAWVKEVTQAMGVGKRAAARSLEAKQEA
ncbi:hypothetical protein FRC04_005344 [Tulasnella sp. 424]|nr:hypothetical protein FRC04_005344 [Tulasnella sp. 424]KAG8976454.1 hypothetical protein FRC05_003697 [Tulasnella sp. 425]